MGITTGLIIIVTFLWTLPDGRLHIIFCNVGQGDSAYIKFPDGRDMVVDGGPDNTALLCLGKYMPMWDRTIDIVLLTHPQKDHLQGFVSLLDRYTVRYMVKSDVDSNTDGYNEMQKIIKKKNIPVRFVVAGDSIRLGNATVHILWPTEDQIARGKNSLDQANELNAHSSSVLGVTSYASPTEDTNHFSVVFALQYGKFDAFFPGDADSNVESNYIGELAGRRFVVLKVPHHGSKTGMTEAFVQWLQPKIAVISVGRNSFGHPSSEALQLLQTIGSRIIRTDKVGDIEIVSDGRSYWYKGGKNIAL